MNLRKRTRRERERASFQRNNNNNIAVQHRYVHNAYLPVIVACTLAFVGTGNNERIALAFQPSRSNDGVSFNVPLIRIPSRQKARRTNIISLFGSCTDDVTTITGATESQDLSTNHSTSKLVLAHQKDGARSLPPWLERYQNCRPEQVKKEIQRLEKSLGERGFADSDARDIIKAIYLAGRGQVPMILGCIIFCQLLLRLEEEDVTTTTTTTSTTSSSSTTVATTTTTTSSNYLATKDVILAAILHYTECFTARSQGIYDPLFPPAADTANHDLSANHDSMLVDDEYSSAYESEQVLTSSSSRLQKKCLETGNAAIQMRELSSEDWPTSLRSRLGLTTSPEDVRDIFSLESIRLAESVSQIKRAEILTHTFLTRGKPWNAKTYEDMRNMLVTLSEDWRALAIRCVASLYRLEGVADSAPLGYHRSSEATLNAKDSLRVYATLAQRLGLHRLKTQLEATSFRILYPRQYSAATTLFQEHGTAMRAVSSFLSTQLQQMLAEDGSLMYELEDLQVVARVKEPYSFWRKLLKKRWTGLARNSVDSSSDDRIDVLPVSRPSKDISVIDVNDGVALRVILKARKIGADETDETTRSRERMLCYYIQRIILSRWPAVDPARIKDYIRSPKANGYQSLHHTSKISRNGHDFFFEIQIRSEEMHRLAEFGVAAHWTYKLDRKQALLNPKSTHSSLLDSQTFPDSSLSNNAALVLFQRQSASESTTFENGVGSIAAAESASYIHALQQSRKNLLQSHVYVFLAGSMSSGSGQLLSLNAGSIVMDVIDSLQEQQNWGLSKDELKIWKNGRLALLEETVRNGDMLLIEPDMSSTEKRMQSETSEAGVS
ncbi:(p)ppGpp synthetase I SpoT/RelA domain containing protein [Nitzschia inconspicua]|uniref:(P)ppGpp synthetase I SpoT/RelA domain containing protein n=1 Tax=Nitzschia inconspicua TaxID=303405 RepID=A0A9K3PRP5_9STRA|nr:(p)ppGpp synthetase I SpoT/RelA domain containing protein [Nitzschia inconspicua]